MNASDLNTPLRPRPVFLIGAARSGTKFLRDLAAPCDDVAAIPFDVNFIWRMGNESRSDDVIPANLPAAQLARLRRAILHAASPRPHQVVLEKTVSNALRVPLIRAVFPEAKFVHLIRDGRSVIESVERVWDQPTPLSYKLSKMRYYPWSNFGYAVRLLRESLPGNQRQRVWGVRYQDINDDLPRCSRMEICAKQWAHCVEAAQRDLAGLPAEDLLTIRYETLVSDRDVARRFGEFLGTRRLDQLLRNFDRDVRQDTQDKWKKRFGRSVSQTREIADLIDPLQRRLGYESLADAVQAISTDDVHETANVEAM